MQTTNRITESTIENFAIELIEELGYSYVYAPDFAPDSEKPERKNFSDVILASRLKEAIETINPSLSLDLREQALKAVLNLPSQNLLDNNETFHKLLVEGVPVEFEGAYGIQGEHVWLIDFKNIKNNDFLVCNQFTVENGNLRKRPDIVIFVNGLPLVVIELKNPLDEDATAKVAFDQIQRYKNEITPLFYYNSLLIASDGFDAKAGSLTADWSRFSTWKTKDGKKEESLTIPQLETLIKGMLKPEVLLDLIKDFTVFEKAKKEDKKTGQIYIETVKKIAAYHQYYVVNKAIESTKEAIKENGSRKIGVVWHTQGSGKSLSMVFYSGKIVQESELKNPTVVIITDRNDLDSQLFDNFASCKSLLRQDPIQAENRTHLKELLTTSGGGIVFTTIQKFSPEDGRKSFDELSPRKNIIVIADEAHRSQYGFKGKATPHGISYGFAKYLRDALPHASFIGFTGTPIEKDDISTPAVFGDYIDKYDISQAVSDGATVKILYESRLVKIHLDPVAKNKLDEEIESLTEQEEDELEKNLNWKQLEKIVGSKERLKLIAKDIVNHFENREEAFEGKALIVAMSRRIACDLYEEIIALKPDWHSKDLKKGEMKVVITSNPSDIDKNIIANKTTKEQRKDLAERFKTPDDELKIVIVRDMWLTGFDVPCLHTMYIDKPMHGHNLMQAIARVNRVYKDKPGGLIVDYIGIATDLKEALATYTESGGEGEPAVNIDEYVPTMLEKYEVVTQLFNGFDYKRYFNADIFKKLSIILKAQEYILSPEIGKERFNKQVTLLSRAFALCVPHPKAIEIRDDIAFFQAVKVRLSKFESSGSSKLDEETETAIRQIIDQAIVTEKVIDIFDAAGLKKPDISILSDEFLEEVKGMQRKNLALELLRKLLNNEVKTREKKNLILGKKFSKMLENAIKKYQNKLLTSAQIIEELIKLAKDIRESDKRGTDYGLNENELAFYDALANNNSAKDILGDDILRELARVLVKRVKENTSIDWTIKESVQAKLRVIVRRTLRQYGYPPDLQELAIENVLKQSEMLADEWS